MVEHNWQYILDASRQFLDALRLNAGSVRRFDASQSHAAAVFASNVGRAIGHPASNARVRMSRDPRCEGIRRDDAEVAGTFHTLYASRPNVRLAALRLWQFYCREAVTRLLTSHADFAQRQDAIADLVNLGAADLAELEAAINQLALATGNLALAQVQGAAGPPVELSTRGFEVKTARIADELSRLADLLELIANGEADDIRDGDGWQTRTDAGLHVARLQALLNYGDLDFADCDFPTLERLKSLWSSIQRLDFGDHSDRPKDYRGALFLPHELGPLQIGPNEYIPDQVLRGADEPYEILSVSSEAKLAAARAVKLVKRQTGSSARERELASHALSSLSEGWTTTKRDCWGQFPEELRRVASWMKSPTAQGKPTSPEADSPIADGPLSDCRWQFQGQTLIGSMPPQVHKLASYLFKFKDERDVPFAELVSNEIFKDEYVDDQTIAKHGRLVTKWFKERTVPLKVSSTTVDRTMTLISL